MQKVLPLVGLIFITPAISSTVLGSEALSGRSDNDVENSSEEPNSNVSPLALGVLTFLSTTGVDAPYKEERYFFDVPQQSLRNALWEFAIQSHATLAINMELSKKLSTPVYGRLTPQQAIETILSRQQVRFEYNPENQQLIIWNQDNIAVDELEEPLLQSSAQASAEATIDTEEMLVKGVRASLMRAASIKLHESSIVDAVTKEDIGKFPDSNLAEAVQRIPGVALNYENNEGSTVSIRGMSPEFGLMTFNNRQMPAVFSRSFDFSRLSSENINSVKVYKTFEAHQDTGATSALIDVETSRPFDLQQNTISVGAKMVYDYSIENSPAVTPEFSGLFSTKNAADNFGFLLSTTYQSRESATQYASLNWIDQFLPEESRFVWYPFELNAGETILNRDRLNAQMALQFAPTDNIEITLDYTYSDFSIEKNNTSVDAVFNYDSSNPESLVFFNDDTVISATESFGWQYGFGKTGISENVELNSIGFNSSIFLNDSWQLEIDAHNSNSKQQPESGNSLENITKITFPVYSQSFNLYNEIPYFSALYEQYGDVIEITDIPPLESFLPFNEGYVNRHTKDATINGFKLDLTWDNQTTGLVSKVLMGYHFSEFTVESNEYSSAFFDPDEFLGLPIKEYNTEIFGDVRTLDILDRFDGDLGPGAIVYDFNIDDLAQSIVERIDSHNVDGEYDYFLSQWQSFLTQTNEFQSATQIVEKTNSAYLQINMTLDNQYVPVEIYGGIRFEHTTGQSRELSRQVVDLRWRVDEFEESEFFPEYAEDMSTISEPIDYDFWLPSLLIKFHLSDALIARASYNKSVSRPSTFLMELGYDYEQYVNYGADYKLVKGNPDLRPYTTTNYDLSVEWYYSDANYIALSRFEKKIDNFPAQAVYDLPSTTVRDVYSGPRYQQARDALLEELGTEPSDAEIYYRITEGDDEARQNGLTGDENDPFVVWTALSLVNSSRVLADGWEFAIQHIFEKSGFGFSFNYAILDSDQKILDFAADDRTFGDFELPTITARDSANFIGFFESERFQARVAYHWNKEYSEYQETDLFYILPLYRESYGQIDALVSYNWGNFTFSLEGFNLTEEGRRSRFYNEKQFSNAEQSGRRLVLGLRYSL